MSDVKIRAALETALVAVMPTFQFAWENVMFVPTAGIPFAKVTLKMAQPQNPTLGAGFHRERGIMFVGLAYPLGQGSLASMTQAELIKTAFARGSSFASNGVTVIVDSTPEIVPAITDADRYNIPVKIRFWADIYN
ncbi:phage tail terminator-like protein [Solimicrobium silvestre]|uniref:Uncharacterized protein n=1 Tax=Solimicrobium silvestre TaxID=2099400 RepID=A0A2S9GY80_9BURK|nr:phage tail terminator-like protein [Solimicrobium silvestre]PRC92673.1 Bacteriophage related domain of unknown function [Solimicrobium silvestre]